VGRGQFTPIFRVQVARLAPRRIADANGNAIVCHDHEVTTAFYIYSIDLTLREQAKRAAARRNHDTYGA
jgi:hypothetical protein